MTDAERQADDEARQAVAAERERCARIAETDIDSIPCPSHYSAEVARVRGRCIAKAIRSGKP